MNIKRIQFLVFVFLVQLSVVYAQNNPFLSNNSKLTGELSFGQVYDFSLGEAAFMAIDSISPDKVIIVYRDWENSGFGTAVVGTINDMEMSFLDPAVFASGNIFLPNVKVLNDSVFLVIYRDMQQQGKGFIIKGEIENESIVFGSPQIFSEAMISTTSLIFMNESDFIIAFKNNGNNGYGTIQTGSLSDGNIILGENLVFNEATSFDNVLTRLTDTTFIISYRDMANNEKGTVKVGMFMNGNITLGSPFAFSEFKASDISVKSLSTTKFIISYISLDANGVAVIGAVEGEDVPFSDLFQFGSSDVSGTTVVSLSDSIAIISYTDEANSGFGTSIVASINNESIVFEEPLFFNEAGSYTTRSVSISDSAFINVFRNEGNSFYGSAVMGKVIIDLTTGILFYDMPNSIKVFPNPSTGLFTIEGSDLLKIEILDMTGKVLKIIQPSGNKTIVDLKELNRGVYFVKTTSDNESKTQKIILN